MHTRQSEITALFISHTHRSDRCSVSSLHRSVVISQPIAGSEWPPIPIPPRTGTAVRQLVLLAPAPCVESPVRGPSNQVLADEPPTQRSMKVINVVLSATGVLCVHGRVRNETRRGISYHRVPRTIEVAIMKVAQPIRSVGAVGGHSA